MNGNRLPPGQGMPQQDVRMQTDRRRQYQHNPQNQLYNQTPVVPMYNGYAQPYQSAPYNNPIFNNQAYGNAMNAQGYYQYPTGYMPQYQNPGYVPQAPQAPYYPPPYGRTPPPSTAPQLNPNAHFVPAAVAAAAAVATPLRPQHQPSPAQVVSSSEYQHTPNDPLHPWTHSHPSPVLPPHSPAQSSTPPLPQITEPLYAAPGSPEPTQRMEIYVPPVPWFTPVSRVPWPVKYTGEKEQSPPREGYFVLVKDPSQKSRQGGAHRHILDVFAFVFEEPSPAEDAEHGEEDVDTPETSTVMEGSATNHVEKAEKVEMIYDEQGPVPPQEPVNGSEETSIEHSEMTSAESESGVSERKVQSSRRESSDESKTLSARSDQEVQPKIPLENGTNSTSSADHHRPSVNTPDLNGTVVATAPKVGAPKSWANLFKGTPASAPAPPVDPVASKPEASSIASSTNGKPKNDVLADALKAYAVASSENKIAFLEPRGLVNLGNMCYMNSVLQVLVFCIPFYDFLDQVGKQSTHNFKSNTPLLDAMIMFMREFKAIDSATSPKKLQFRLKENELEQYGTQFTPDYIYIAMRGLQRFASMERGKQQDAEEFLGFLLEGLHEECVSIMQSSSANASAMASPTNNPNSPTSESGNMDGDAGWHEVGRKQKLAVTRSSGAIETSSPITKIFGGSFRSEFRVAGKNASITMQPFQTLQLDIGSPQVNNIIDALKAITIPETIHGDFDASRGVTTAKKQIFISTLPPVLILHLKRFQYLEKDGAQKIWKKIGYPLELEIPKEVLPRKKANTLGSEGLPRYRLTAVVYHHGKNASGGHYTVDVRRQEGREWIRLDDTVIRRIKSEEVAEGGSEEDPKVLAAAAKAQKNGQSTNSFAGINGNEDEEDDHSDSKEWQQVNGSSNANSSKTWSAVANGSNTPKTGSAPKSKADKFSINDDKVAYLLFYQKI